MRTAAAAFEIAVFPFRQPLIFGSRPRAATRTAVASAAPIADTFGWGTVFAIRLDDVNRAIVASGASPSTFDDALASNYRISGTFGTWQLVRGGDGKNVRLAVPVPRGTLSFAGTDYAMDGLTAIVEIGLAYLPTPPAEAPPPSSPGTTHKLQANTQAGGPSEPVASVLQVSFPGGQGPAVWVQALMLGGLNDWFNSHLGEFEHVFSTVNLNLRADTAAFQWLKPSSTSYAYADGDTDDDSVFGVLCVTDRGSTAELTHEITPAAIPAGQRAGFLISPELFLAKSVERGLSAAFVDASPADFALTPDGLSVVLAPGATVKMKPVVHDGSTYQPYLQSFRLVVQDTEIVTDMTAKINVFPGVDVYVYTTSYQTLELINKPDGTQTLGFRQTRPTVMTHETHVASGVTVTFIILQVITAVLALFTDGASEVVDAIVIAVIVAIVIAVEEGVELLITQVLANGVANAMPAINPLVYAATDPVVWPTQQSRFRLTSAQLNGAVVLGGDPDFGGSDE